MKVLERTMFGQDKSLVVVKIGDKIMLLGVTAHHIEKIADLDESDLSQAALGQAVPVNGTFLENLKKATREHTFVKPFLPKEKQGEHEDEQ